MSDCELCNIYNTVQPVGEAQYWKFFVVDNKMYCIWYKHEAIHNLSKCKRFAHELQGRLFQEAVKHFGTNNLNMTGDIDTHVHYTAEVKS